MFSIYNVDMGLKDFIRAHGSELAIMGIMSTIVVAIGLAVGMDVNQALGHARR